MRGTELRARHCEVPHIENQLRGWSPWMVRRFFFWGGSFRISELMTLKPFKKQSPLASGQTSHRQMLLLLV